MTTVLGTTRFDGRGNRRKCLKLIKDCTKDLDLYVYDYEQISLREEMVRQSKYFSKMKEQYKDDKEMCNKIVELKKEMLKKTYLPTLNTSRSFKTKHDEFLNF